VSPEGEAAGSRRRALVLAYDGAAYAGWQVQPDQPTVQGVLEAALGVLVRQPVRVHGSGRTDAGVHALGQVAHFDDPLGLPPERLAAALNSLLPPDIRVRQAMAVAPGFHALHGAVAKTYLYQLHLAPATGGSRAALAAVPPHRRLTFHAVRGDLDLVAMRRAAQLLRGRHDFTALSKAMDEGRGTVKTLRSLRVLRVPHGLRVFATADGFLYGMVRLLAGLLVEVGRGRRDPERVPELLAAADRSRAPALLPPHGLFLWKVRYAPDAATDSRAAACYAGPPAPP
jgi:tRNA pseudouridine38-40 synthase